MTALVLLVTVLAVTFGVRDMLRREREHLDAALRRTGRTVSRPERDER